MSAGSTPALRNVRADSWPVAIFSLSCQQPIMRETSPARNQSQPSGLVGDLPNSELRAFFVGDRSTVTCVGFVLNVRRWPRFTSLLHFSSWRGFTAGPNVLSLSMFVCNLVLGVKVSTVKASNGFEFGLELIGGSRGRKRAGHLLPSD